MPTESARCADIRFIQRFLQEDVDREVRVGHMIQHRDLGLLLQLAERLRSFHSISPDCRRLPIHSLGALRVDVFAAAAFGLKPRGVVRVGPVHGLVCRSMGMCRCSEWP